MLRYVYANDLHRFPTLARTMFEDRALQFKERLEWDVSVDHRGQERDEYDARNPLYVIWENAEGRHGGSMRFLPTVEPCMVNDHFAHLLPNGSIHSPLIWECTRFCLSPNADRRVTAGLVLGAGEIMRRFSLEHYVGVFDPRMERIYRLYGVVPEVIGSAGAGADKIGVGLWEMTPSAWPKTLAKTGISQTISDQWFARSFEGAVSHEAQYASADVAQESYREAV